MTAVKPFTKPNTHKRKGGFIAIALFFSLCLCTFFVYWALENEEDDVRNKQLEAEAVKISQVVERDLHKRIRSLSRIVGRWETRNGTPQAEFKKDVLSYVVDDPGYQAIEWVDNSFYVRWIVPLEGNEKALNLDLGFEKNRFDALQQARDRKKATLSAPINLVQGGKGFLVYNPIFVKGNFQGFVLAVFRTEKWLAGLLDISENEALHDNYLVSVTMDDIEIIKGHGWDNIQAARWEKMVTTTIFERHFLIKVRPTEWFLSQSHTLLPELIFIVGILLALLISTVVYLFQKSHQAIHDTLAINTILAVEMTEREKTQLLLAQERQRLEYILAGTNAGTWEWNVQTGETIINERWASMLGYSIAELSPISIDTWIKLIHPDDLKESTKLLQRNFNKELHYYALEIRMCHKNGDWIWILARGKVFTWTDNGEALLMCGTHQNITERKKSEEKIRYLATHDTLTNLPNLRVTKDRTYMALKQAKRAQTLVAIMFIDLDGFKVINDTYGHSMGDHTLKETASRLLDSVRELDTVTRVGGDEFVIVLPDIKVQHAIEEIANRILFKLSQSIDFEGQKINVGASIGISFYPEHGDNLEALLTMADKAMYDSKKSGKNIYTIASVKNNKKAII